MNKLLIKHNDGVSIREDIFEVLDDDYEMIKLLFILANRAHKRIVDGIDYWEVVIHYGDLERIANMWMRHIYETLQRLQDLQLLSYCKVANEKLLVALFCIDDEK